MTSNQLAIWKSEHPYYSISKHTHVAGTEQTDSNWRTDDWIWGGGGGVE
jgi:hypothetical protein